MNPNDPLHQLTNRKSFIGSSGLALGSIAMNQLMSRDAHASEATGQPLGLHFAPRAKRVIYLFMAGGPSQIDTFDYHPKMRELHGSELPDSIRRGQRLTGMTSKQKTFPCVAPMFKFKKHGQLGTWVSELLPHTAGIVDDLTIIKTMNTEAVNHDPAITFINTGTQIVGKPSLGAWLNYGLGNANDNLPSYIVMLSQGISKNTQALYSRLWGSGFLPSEHQGVKLRSGRQAILYLKDASGIDKSSRRSMLDTLAKVNQHHYDQIGDPEINARISQYEMAYRMQAAIPDVLNLTNEPKHILDLYGPDATKPNTFANNCLRARRLSESGVRFIQLFHRAWDQHSNLPRDIRRQCKLTDQPAAALVKDLKQRGMLDDTLVIWGGEFGRTIYSQGKLTKDNHGRDHHGRCFTYWMAGGGVKKGFEYGLTDDYSYNILENPVHILDFNATVLNLLGINHKHLTFKFQGLDQRLTGVEKRKVIRDIMENPKNNPV